MQPKLQQPLPLLRPHRWMPESQPEALDGSKLLHQPLPISWNRVGYWNEHRNQGTRRERPKPFKLHTELCPPVPQTQTTRLDGDKLLQQPMPMKAARARWK